MDVAVRYCTTNVVLLWGKLVQDRGENQSLSVCHCTVQHSTENASLQ